MKKILVAILLSSIAMPAFAADLSYKRPEARMPMMASAKNWSGFYGGVSAGIINNTGEFKYISDLTPSSGIGPGDKLNTAATGAIAGVQLGLNYQINQIVLGAETDYSFSNTSGKTRTYYGDVGAESKLNAIGTVRGRLGYAFDKALIYGTAGFAYANVKNSIWNDSPYSFKDKKTKTGWTAGLGIEYALTNSLSVKAEGLYYELEKKKTPNTIYQYQNHGLIARVGLNYNFWSPF